MRSPCLYSYIQGPSAFGLKTSRKTLPLSLAKREKWPTGTRPWAVLKGRFHAGHFSIVKISFIVVGREGFEKRTLQGKRQSILRISHKGKNFFFIIPTTVMNRWRATAKDMNDNPVFHLILHYASSVSFQRGLWKTSWKSFVCSLRFYGGQEGEFHL